MSEKSKGWLCLIVSGLLEIVWAYFLKLSNGFSVLLPSIIVIICLTASFFLLGKAIGIFGIGMSYGVFTGIGIAGTTVIGILLLNESAGFWKIISLIILLAGIIGLKFVDKSANKEGGVR